MAKAADGKSSMHVTMRLMREGRVVDDALREANEFREVEARTGRLFVSQSQALPPTWLGFIDEFAVAPHIALASQSCGSILFLQIPGLTQQSSKHIVALTFGTGHHSLDPDAFERNFGLRVVLNCVARDTLRSMDVATLDATTFQKRIQASRNADLSGFGINVERDLLRLAAGVPKDNAFASNVAGRDSLVINTRTSATDIVLKCQKALEYFKSKDYRADFDWIDFVTPIRDAPLIEKLDARVFLELKSLAGGVSSDLHLVLPDILSPEEASEIGYFGVGLRSGAKHTFDEIAIEDYIEELRSGKLADIADMTAIKRSHEIRVVKNGEGDKSHKRKVYDCFVYELDDSDKVYILFGGEWYQIDQGFHTTIEASFTKLVAKKSFCATTSARSERDFIAELDTNPDLLNLDQVKINPTGAKGANLEPCDFFSRDRQFIHLKDGHSSAPISHLWSQGLVSAESFVRDEKFRIDLRRAAIKRQNEVPKKIGFRELFPDGRKKPVPSDYKVVFGILRDRYRKSGVLSLPFFSKVSLRAVSDRIALTGLGLEVHLIERLSS